MSNHILIVEDEPTIADNITLALESEGFISTWVSTLGEARKLLLEKNFIFIILDVGLPDGDGFSLCRELRQNFPKNLQTPVLFLTARDNEIDRVVGLELGADDYLTKPFSPRELTARIKAILRRVAKSTGAINVNSKILATEATEREQKKEQEFCWGPFRVDQKRQRCFYFEQFLDLSLQESKLLRYFLQYPGQVFNREQLLQHAWDSPEAVLDRTVDAHIKSLRAKLKSVRPDWEAIVTHRGLGYSLKEDWSS